MENSVDHLLQAAAFMPHGMCYLWQPGVLSLHVVSDGLIALAYSSIPFTLLYFVRKRPDLRFNWMFVCFALFIVACGATHVMEIWTVWYPDYWVSGVVKAVTALASVPTAILLIRLVPEALRVPSQSSLQSVNLALAAEVRVRQQAEEEIRRINAGLESRVAERTAELQSINRQLVQALDERRHAEESSRSSQNLLQTMADNASAVLYAKDLDGRYLLINSRFEQIFHLKREDLLGRTGYEFLKKEDADAFRAMDQRVIAADTALTEEEIVPEDDGPHVYISVKAPLRDSSGKPYGIFGFSTDVTELKHAERALRASEQKQRAQLERLDLLDRITRAIGEHQDIKSIYNVVLRSLEDHLPVDFICVCLYDHSDATLSVAATGVSSRACAQELGLEEGSRIGIDENGLASGVRGELVYEPDLAQADAALPARLTRGGLRSLVMAPLAVENRVFGVMLAARRAPESFSSAECEFLRQLCQHVALAAHQAQLYAALQAAYEDLRQSQQTIMQQERLRALGQMTSGIAHDINNALSPASLYAQVLLDGDKGLPSDVREKIIVIQRAIDDVSLTVTRMREFCRRDERPLAPVKINSMIEQVIELTRARWSAMPQERGVVVSVEKHLASSDLAVNGADNEIRDALTNLVFNAVDAMPEGGTLTLRTRSEAGQIIVEVSDTGIGMDEKTRSRCFEPFFTTKGERGTGLGLAMVFGMAQRHNALVEVDSVPGHGTTMRLLFPAALASVTRGQEPAPRSLPRPVRILLVDDDALVRKTLQTLLAADGHIVSAADGGQAGLDEFRVAHDSSEPFALVITDLGMPYVDGRAVAAAVKALCPTTPVLLLTGWGNRMLDDSDIPLHVDRVLGKPPNLQRLRAVIAELTAKSNEPSRLLQKGEHGSA
jgi:PAS domain S-box-containing protein